MNGGALALTQPKFNVSHIPSYGSGAEFDVLGERALRHESVDCRSWEPRDLNDCSDPEDSGSTAWVHMRLIGASGWRAQDARLDISEIGEKTRLGFRL